MSGLVGSYPRRKFGGHSLHLLIVTVLLIVSTVINVLQARKVSQLRNTIEVLKSEWQLTVGSSVPPIDARDVSKTRTTLTYTSGAPPTVLYVFSPQCVWCSHNLSSVKTLATGIDGRYRFVTISLSEEGLEEYIKNTHFDFPVFTGLSVGTLRAYKFGGTPQTLVISNDGRVQKNWMGAYTGPVKTEIENYFSLQLPDLPVQDVSTR